MPSAARTTGGRARASMIVFQNEPDPIFLTIVDEALSHVREVHLLRDRQGYRPRRADRRDLAESYRELFPEIIPFFARRGLVRVIEWLRRASRDEHRRFEGTGLPLAGPLRVPAGLLPPAQRRGAGRAGGPYEIEHIDFDAIVDRFFLGADFLLGTALLSGEGTAPGQLRVTRQAWKPTASLRPEVRELRLTAVAGPDGSKGGRAPVRRVPVGGYVGSYPLRDHAEHRPAQPAVERCGIGSVASAVGRFLGGGV